MATFLQLSQALANRSGIIPNSGPVGSAYALPSAVASATGTLLKMTGWVAEAWNDIQIARRDWFWMQTAFSGETVASDANYAYTDMTGPITRFSQWLFSPTGDSGFTIYPDATGRVDERMLPFVPWEIFRRVYRRGSNLTVEGFPTIFSVSPDRQIYLWPVPDDVYVMNGVYKKSPQILSADADTPEMPTEFHDLIWMRAWKTAEIYDDSYTRFAFIVQEERRLYTALLNNQCPAMSMGDPLA
jgi:hypothetical protein